MPFLVSKGSGSLQSYGATTVVPRSIDSDFSNVVLAINSETISTESGFKDDSATPNFIKPYGDTKVRSFNPYQYGHYSVYFDGTGDNLASASDAGLAFGTGDFTMECWHMPMLGGYQRLWQFSSDSDNIDLHATGTGSVSYYNGSTLVNSAAGLMKMKAWNHIALVRYNGVVQVYVNGAVALTQSSTPNSSTRAVNIAGTSTNLVNGYISNLRVVKGIAVYKGRFDPPTQPLQVIDGTTLFTCNNNRFVDSSPFNVALTRNGDTKVVPIHPFDVMYNYNIDNYSTYFDGSGDYLSTPYTTNFNCPTSFTIEFWAYPISRITSYPTIFSNYSTYTTNGQIGIFCGHASYSTKWSVSFNGTDGVLVSTSTIVYNSWVHIAVVRNGTAMTMYVNGVAEATSTQSATLAGTQNSIWIGASGDSLATTYYNGHVSNLRFVKGQALYTTTFTPSTTSLTTTSQGATAANVSLLTCQNNTIIDNSTNAFAITSNGDARPQSLNPFSTPSFSSVSTAIDTFGSVYFDGTGDYLTTPINGPGMQISSGAYTIEMWIYLTSQPTTYYIFDTRRSSGLGNFMLKDSTTLAFGDHYTSLPYNISITNPIVSNRWEHWAIVREGTGANQFKVYQNGVLAGTGTASTTTAGSLNFAIGATTDGTYGMTGYISNFRFVNGTALYTANFTPPAAPLARTANTTLLIGQYKQPQNNSLVFDASLNSSEIISYGNVSVGTFTPFGNTWSTYFNNDNFVSNTNSYAIAFGTGDYTVEGWFYQYGSQSLGGTFGLATGSGGMVLSMSDTDIVMGVYGGSTNILSASKSWSKRTWYHIALVRQNGVAKIYINGVESASASQTQNWTGTAWYIGASTGQYFWGLIYNFRVVRGSALYTSNFTPQTTPLTAVSGTTILTCVDKTFYDRSANNYTLTLTRTPSITNITPTLDNKYDYKGVYSKNWTNAKNGTSVYIDGIKASSYLAYSSLVDTQRAFYAPYAFTWEAWVNPATITWELVSCVTASAGVFWYEIYHDATGLNLNFGNWGVSSAQALTSALVPTNAWTHVVVQRRPDNTIDIFYNGILQSVTNNFTGGFVGADATPNAVLKIGGGGYYACGPIYISDLRFVGSRVYTGNFTPPAVPLASTPNKGFLANTGLLLNSVPAILDYSLTNNIETRGNVSVTSTQSPRGTNYSNYFDGSANYLSTPNNTNFDFGTGDFTIEFWLYVINMSGTAGIVGKKTSDATNGWQVYHNYIVANTRMSIRTTLTNDFSSNSSWTVNKWDHWAVTRSNSTIRWFKNGILDNSATNNYNLSDTANTFIGYSQTWSGYYNGHISNLRIVKGESLYNSNFTPSTTPLTATSQGATAANVVLLTCQSNRFIDNGANNLPINAVNGTIVSMLQPFERENSLKNKSIYFDIEGDYLRTSTANSGAYIFGSDNFTAEAWIYPKYNTGTDYLFAIGAETTNRFVIILSGGALVTNLYGYGTFRYGSAIQANAWSHIAIVRSGTSINGYINGVLLANTETNSLAIGNGPLRIGSDASGTTTFRGYMDDIRITRGVARYTGNNTTYGTFTLTS